MKAVFDNDVILKGACYGLLPKMCSAVAPAEQIGALGAAKYVLADAIRRKKLKGDKSAVLNTLQAFLGAAQVLEPSPEEQKLAADLEEASQRAGLSLDGGESQLCAFVVTRLVPILFTGDNRAIDAIEVLIDSVSILGQICGKVISLEQIIARLLSATTAKDLRTAICAESEVDRALSICFSCSSPDLSSDNHFEALRSYIGNLRSKAKRILGD
jgi:hypothetical protein